jgi:hypothetical protein
VKEVKKIKEERWKEIRMIHQQKIFLEKKIFEHHGFISEDLCVGNEGTNCSIKIGCLKWWVRHRVS